MVRDIMFTSCGSNKREPLQSAFSLKTIDATAHHLTQRKLYQEEDGYSLRNISLDI